MLTLPGAIIIDQPGVLLLLAVLVPLAAVLGYAARRACRDLRALRRAASLPAAKPAPDAVLRFKRSADGALTCVAVACVILGAAGVRWGAGWPAPAPTGSEVVVLIDLSRSMAAADVAPSRLRRGVAAAGELVEELPAAAIAVVGFSDTGHLLLPFTDDRYALRQQLAALHDQAPALGGSQLAAALRYASFELPGRPDAVRTVVLVSDGESSAGDPLPVARRAGHGGVAIVTVPVGTTAGAPVPGAGGEHSARDEHAMREIARVSGGVLADPLLPRTMAEARTYLARVPDAHAANRATARRPRYAVLALAALLALAGCAAVRAIRWRATF